MPEDLRQFAWWIIRGVVSGRFGDRQASVLVAAGRLAAGLGPDTDAEEDALAATVLRGRVMHGMPPDGEDEWALAESLFTPGAIREMRRWGSVERDLVDHGEPGALFEGAALEPELAGLVHVEDRVGREL